jgi:hypothetical protein
MSKLTNITAPQHRCPVGECPAVYKSEDGRTFTIVGKRVMPIRDNIIGPGEEAVEIPAEILLSALGVTELVEAAKHAEKELLWASDQFEGNAPLIFAARALRSIIDRIKGGVNG